MYQKFPVVFLVVSFLGVICSQNIFADLDYYSEIGFVGSGNANLKGPTDVVMSSNGKTVYVADSENNRINVFDDNGDYDFKFGTFCSIFSIQNCNDDTDGADNDGDGQFDNPISVVIDSSGDLYVVDSDNGRIQKFRDDGKFELKFGSTDSTDSDYLGSPQGIAILDSTRDIYVSDTATDSIRVFDSSGDFLYSFDSFDGNDDFTNPSFLLIDNTDDILYVSDSGNDQIVMFQLVDGNTCPSGTDEVIDGVCFIEKFGSSGSGDGKFNSPAGLALDELNDLLYVADTDNDRIQILSLDVSSLAFVPGSPQNLHAYPLSPTSVKGTLEFFEISISIFLSILSIFIDSSVNNRFFL